MILLAFFYHSQESSFNMFDMDLGTKFAFKFFVNNKNRKKQLAVLTFALLMAKCTAFAQASPNCLSYYNMKSDYLNWTYFGFISGFKGQALQGKQKDPLLPSETSLANPLLYYFKNQFSFNKAPVISFEEITTQRNTHWLETNSLLEFVYNKYRQRRIVPDSWVSEYLQVDKQFEPQKTSYISFSDPRTDETLLVVRIIDTSPTHKLRLQQPSSPIPLELKFPHLALPDRINGNHDIIEIGRLAKDEEKVQGSIDSLLRAIAVYVGQSHYEQPTTLSRKGNEPALYIEASEASARFYSRYGFKILFGPNDTKEKDTYILRLGADSLVKNYYLKNSFYSLK